MRGDGPDWPGAARDRTLAAQAGLWRGLSRALGALAGGRPAEPIAPAPEAPLEALVGLFGLSEPERLILLLAAGCELDAGVAAEAGRRPDVAMALALAGDAGWPALCPGASLRRWRLVEPGSGPMLRRELGVDERVLQFLMGVSHVDARLDGLVRLLPPAEATSFSDQAAASWAVAGDWPVLVVEGSDPTGLHAALAAAATAAGLVPLGLDAAHIPADAAARRAFAVLADRELALSGAALIVETAGEADARAAAELAEALMGPVALVGPDPVAPRFRARLRLRLPAEGRAGRRRLWRRALGLAADGLDLERLSEQFPLDRGAIEAAVRAALAAGPGGPAALFDRLWDAAREQGRRQLDGLAERIVSRAGWGDLVLPREAMAQLKDLAAQVRHAATVRDGWGWEARGPRGLGAAALFAGASGTGKTLAAEVLAGELGLDLYRIDLSQTVDKYIGETEKNLARIFAAAEEAGAILLFDEADALFGKRSEVRDSHDRYANLEVSYLLQRMESFRGLAILTSNQKSALDGAFQRRLRAIVSFPFPDAAARAAIWQRVFPAATPRQGLDPERLARLNLTGGAIRSIALNASFLAAAEGVAVGPAQVLKAARREYAKLEKPVSAAELEGFA